MTSVRVYINLLGRNIGRPERGRLARHRVNELLVGFDPARRTVIARDFMRGGHQPGAVPRQHGLDELINRGGEGGGPDNCQMTAIDGDRLSSPCGGPEKERIHAWEMPAHKAQARP